MNHLEKFYDAILSCRIVVSAPHRHKNKGKIYHIQMRLHVAGKDLIINRAPEKTQDHEDIFLAIHDSFSIAIRQLEDFVKRRRSLKKGYRKLEALNFFHQQQMSFNRVEP